METYYYLGSMGHIKSTEAEGYELSYKLRKMMGNCFKSPLEAEAYVNYILAREVIKEDTKGFKPNWQNTDDEKYYGEWDFNDRVPHIGLLTNFKKPQIYFKSKQDIIDSFARHPKEWKIYLTYKQQ